MFSYILVHHVEQATRHTESFIKLRHVHLWCKALESNIQKSNMEQSCGPSTPGPSGGYGAGGGTASPGLRRMRTAGKGCAAEDQRLLWDPRVARSCLSSFTSSNNKKATRCLLGCMQALWSMVHYFQSFFSQNFVLTTDCLWATHSFPCNQCEQTLW